MPTTRSNPYPLHLLHRGSLAASASRWQAVLVQAVFCAGLPGRLEVASANTIGCTEHRRMPFSVRPSMRADWRLGPPCVLAGDCKFDLGKPQVRNGDGCHADVRRRGVDLLAQTPPQARHRAPAQQPLRRRSTPTAQGHGLPSLTERLSAAGRLQRRQALPRGQMARPRHRPTAAAS